MEPHSQSLKNPEDSSKHTAGRPERLPFTATDEQPSKLYQAIVRNNLFPPILQNTSQAVPYKEVYSSRTLVEVIGNHFHPRAKDLKIQQFYRRPRASPQKMSKNVISSPLPLSASNQSDSVREKQEPTSSILAGKNVIHSEEYGMIPGCIPLTPEEQLHILRSHLHQEWEAQAKPSDEDLDRYLYYITTGVANRMVAPLPAQQVEKVLSLVPGSLRNSKDKTVNLLKKELLEELHRDYVFSMKKSIVDYILMDSSERKRLLIFNTPCPFPKKLIRAPVPWRLSHREANSWHNLHLFTVNPIMLRLQELWMNRFSSVRFVVLKDLTSSKLPLEPKEFMNIIKSQCQHAFNTLTNDWLASCTSLFLNNEELWLHLVPKRVKGNPERVQEFFSCTASLMSMQLRSVVTASLQDLLKFFMMYQEGNDFGEEYNDQHFLRRQVLSLKLMVEGTHVVLQPSLQECSDLLCACFLEIIKSAEDLPRVEANLFPEVVCSSIQTVTLNEPLVIQIIGNAMEIVDRNEMGPERYLMVYKKYYKLLNKSAIQEIELLKDDPVEDLIEKLSDIQALWTEINSLTRSVPLSMYCLDASGLHGDLCSRTEQLQDVLLTIIGDKIKAEQERLSEETSSDCQEDPNKEERELTEQVVI